MSLCPVSKVNLLVIFFEPAVNVPSVAVAPDVPPVIISVFAIKSLPLVMINVIGFVVLIITALHPLVPPVIISPFVNVPDTPVTVNCGRTGFALASSESNTAYNLYASAIPRDISLCWEQVPYSSPEDASASTRTAWQGWFVFVFSTARVLVRVAVTFTFAPLPRTFGFVIVREFVPSPEKPVVVVELKLIVSPAAAVTLPLITLPAVRIVTI